MSWRSMRAATPRPHCATGAKHALVTFEAAMRHTVNCLLHRPQHASLFSVTTKQRAAVGGSVKRHRVQRQGTPERQLPHLKTQRRRRPMPASHTVERCTRIPREPSRRHGKLHFPTKKTEPCTFVTWFVYILVGLSSSDFNLLVILFFFNMDLTREYPFE